MGGLRGAVKDSLKDALVALERSGCEGAGYRLSGEAVHRLCVVHLHGTWRLRLAFPEPDVAVVIDVGEHLAHDPRRDIYARLYEVLALAPSAELRSKPPCCDDDGLPPVASEAVEDLVDAYRGLMKVRRRRRQS